MKYGMSSLAWQSPFHDAMGQFELAKKYGCDIYEIAIEDFATLKIDEILAAKEATGIETPTVCGAHGETRDCSSDDPAIRANGVQYIKDMVDFATKIGANTVVGPLYSACGKARALPDEARKQAWAWGVESLKECADYAGQKGVRLGVEPLNRFETDFINTIAQGLEFIDAIGYDNVGFLLDTFHQNIEENDIPAAYRSAAGKIYDMHTCANNRGTPGEDNFNWPAIAAAVKDAGYNDYCIIESFTPDCVEIAKSASVWRPFSPSPEYIAEKGIPFLRSIFG